MSKTRPDCRLPRSIVFCAPADSPNANCSSIKPPRAKSTKPSLPIRSGSLTCSSAPVARSGGGKQQVFLQAALDDASRLIPHAQFYPNQGLDAFLDCLRQAIAARGIPTRLYMDNAKIYRSPQLARIAASIGILIVHTPPYQPEGRGKIERFFRSVREQFLASLDPKVVLCLEQLNEHLWHWLDTDYHRREHSSLQSTPLVRWQRDIEQVRQLPPATDLRRLFFHRVDRLVRRDSTFLLKNYFFDAPSHLAGKRLEVRLDPHNLTP